MKLDGISGDEPLKLWLSIELGKYKERVAYRQDAICLFLEQDELENALMNWVRSWVWYTSWRALFKDMRIRSE